MRFVACDWGTSNFRLRLVDGKVLRELKSGDGVATLAAAGADRAAAFKAVLKDGLEKLKVPGTVPVVISGMAGSSIGWKELPYAKVPFAFDGSNSVWDRVAPHVYLISGLRTDTEILRGEETEAIGLVSLIGRDMPFEAIFVLPGTHSKHLDVNPGGIATFRTYMTGELFDLLSRQSVLRHSTDPEAPLDKAAFLEGVEESTKRPVTGALFRVRTRQVLDKKSAKANTSFLSGLLIGSELCTLRGSDVAIILAAGKVLRGSYVAAAEALGLGSRLRAVDSEGLSVLGQGVLLKRILK